MNDPKWMGTMAGTAFVTAVCSVVIALNVHDIKNLMKDAARKTPIAQTACKLT